MSSSNEAGKIEEHHVVSDRSVVTHASFREPVPIRPMKTRSTPVSETKTQALVRVLSAVTHGYTRLCTGTVPPHRLPVLISKFDSAYGIANTKAQRVVNKRAGRANTLFAVYRPPEQYLMDGERLPWILLATEGAGLETETLTDVLDRPVWLDYQLCRHNDMGAVRWTWRRTHSEMTQLYAQLREALATRQYTAVSSMFERLARQPGFHGVRTQAMALFSFAISRGYPGPIPRLFFVQKIVHGRPIAISR